jgi:hypothetical protein
VGYPTHNEHRAQEIFAPNRDNTAHLDAAAHKEEFGDLKWVTDVLGL